MKCTHCGMEIIEQFGLTRKQKVLYEFIASYFNAHDICPSFDEMSAALKVSRGSIQNMTLRLEERGHITRVPNRARSIVPIILTAVEAA